MTATEARDVLADYMGNDAELSEIIGDIIEEAAAERPDGAFKALAGYGKQLAIHSS